jgi:thioredoxin type arsenate reductase
MTAGTIPSDPPLVLKLISNDLRWRLLAALATSDLKVQELVWRLGRPQNLVSYHLHRLRTAGLLNEHRSAADGRVVYYSLNFEALRLLFFEAGEALHPSLSADEPETGTGYHTLGAAAPPVRVLFLCTHNSARSQMAEGILRQRMGKRVDVFSAGTEATQVNPLAVRAMADMNIDISGQRSKHLDEFRDQKFNYVITVCDRARESCPIFPGDPEQIHWSFPDPAAVEGTEEERYAAFRETALQINNRIGLLVLLINKNRSKEV